MSYIEITIWNPFRKGNFTLKPSFSMWPGKDGFDFEWLFISINASFYKGDE